MEQRRETGMGPRPRAQSWGDQHLAYPLGGPFIAVRGTVEGVGQPPRRGAEGGEYRQVKGRAETIRGGYCHMVSRFAWTYYRTNDRFCVVDVPRLCQ